MNKEPYYEFINLPPQYKDKDSAPQYYKRVVRYYYPKGETKLFRETLPGHFTQQQASNLDCLKKLTPSNLGMREGNYNWQRVLLVLNRRNTNL